MNAEQFINYLLIHLRTLVNPDRGSTAPSENTYEKYRDRTDLPLPKVNVTDMLYVQRPRKYALAHKKCERRVKQSKLFPMSTEPYKITPVCN